MYFLLQRTKDLALTSHEWLKGITDLDGTEGMVSDFLVRDGSSHLE